MLDSPLLAKKLLHKFNLRYENLINWNKILVGQDRKTYLIKKSSKKKRILIATSTGGHLVSAQFDSILAFALTLNNCEVEILLCNKQLTACQQSTTKLINEKDFAINGTKKLCNSCYDSGKLIFDGLDLKILNFSDYFNNQIEEKIKTKLKNYNYQKFQDLEIESYIKEHALAGALRFYAVGNLDEEKYRKEVLYKYLYSALKTNYIFKNIITEKKYDTIILNHGIYVPQGIIANVAKKKSNIVCYHAAYKKKSFTFSHDDTYHFTMMNEDTKLWEKIKWTKKIDHKLMNYLTSRRYGRNDWEYYYSKAQFNYKKRFQEYGIDLKKPIIGMLTNTIWDAVLTYPNNIFSNMLEWIFLTIDLFSKKNDIQLVIRIHPAEVKSDRVSKQKVYDEIKKKYKSLPKNIFIIDSSDEFSSYCLIDFCDTVLIYSTKMGMEFSPFGIPVICAGESYIKNKKITLDPKNKEEYVSMLNLLPFKKKLNKSQILRAKKYAYHFFFRRMITIESLEYKPHQWPPFILNKNGVKKILQNKDKGFNQICHSIHNNLPFIFKDEKYN